MKKFIENFSLHFLNMKEHLKYVPMLNYPIGILPAEIKSEPCSVLSFGNAMGHHINFVYTHTHLTKDFHIERNCRNIYIRKYNTRRQTCRIILIAR